MDSIVKALYDIAESRQILENEPMSRRTTFRVGGSADVLFLPESEEKEFMIALARYAVDRDV